MQQINQLLTQRAGDDVTRRQRGQRRTFGDDEDVFVLIADEGRRQRFAVGANLRFAIYANITGQMNFDDIALVQDAVGAGGLSVDEDGFKHFQPAEGMLPQRKASGDNTAHGAPFVCAGYGVGQNAHGCPPLFGKMISGIIPYRPVN